MSHEFLKLLVASTNPKKLKELHDLLDGLPIELRNLKDFPKAKEVPETGATFEENASLKALGYAAQTGLLTLAEDSGLCCDALDGAPGVYSARFAGLDKDDAENNRKVLESLKNIPLEKRSAKFVSTIAIAEPGRIVGILKGEVHGLIADHVSGTNGFGYDPIFFYPPYGKTFGEVSSEMKHKVSHRAKSLAQARQLIEGYLQKTV